jgi:hypothetical protein
MTNELNDLVPAQEKLEWITPKISLMDGGGDGRSKAHTAVRERTFRGRTMGPSG